MAKPKRQCKQVKADGKRCRAIATSGSNKCFFHDEDKAIERKAAQRRGHCNSVAPGTRHSIDLKTLPPGTPDVKIKSASDVTKLLALTVSQVRRGEIGVRVATATGYLCSYILKSREHGEIENRLAEIEKHIQQKEGGIK